MGRGRLLFKGDEKKPKKKKKQSKHEINTNTAAVSSTEASTAAAHSRADPPSEESKRSAAVSAAASASAAAVTSESSKPSAAAAAAATAAVVAGPKIQQGKGEIVTSGTVVTGHDTIFTRQINPGDALLVQLPLGQEEMRVVTMRLSDTSINLSSGFSQNLATPTPFRFIAKPGNKSSSRSKSQQQSTQQQQQHGNDNDIADGAAAAADSDHRELVYRERTEHGSYRIRRVQLDQEVTRGTLLEMRAKKKSDKYC